MESRLINVDVRKLRPNPQQPRQTFDEGPLQELADSIKAEGVIQPIEVEAADGGGFILHHGERRWRAAQRAGLEFIPAIVKPKQDDLALLLRAVIENVQREDMNPIDEGRAYARLIELRLSRAEICRQTGKTHTHVANVLSWLECEPEIQELVAAGTLAKDKRVRQAVQSVPAEIRVRFAKGVAGQTIEGIQKAAAVLAPAASQATKPTRQKCPPLKREVRRAYALTLVLNDCPVPGPAAVQVEQAAQQTCMACPLWDFKPEESCRICPLTRFVQGYVASVKGVA